jgi:hypothetical protein
MARGCRRIVVAFVGFLILAANHAYAKGSDKQAAAESAVAASLQNIASSYDQATERAKGTEEEEAKCGSEKYGSNTDLCAQWKAADAASDSAWWAWASGIVGIGSLLGVIAALCIALHSNWIARDTAKRQLRAYLTLGDCSVAVPQQEHFFDAKIFVTNSGQTPARNVIWHTTLEFRRPDDATPFVLRQLDTPPSKSIVGPDGSTHTHVRSRIPLSKRITDEIHAGTAIAWIFGTITYDDVFGERHSLSFRYFYDAPVNGLCAAPDGNAGD